MGWLDVAAEPVIVTIPDMDEGRYWILHTMDMGHYTNSMIGSRVRGHKGGMFMFTPKGWEGEMPASVTQVIKSDSNILKLMGRIMDTGGEDSKIALSYMDQWNIRTLSEFLGQNGPKPVERTYPDLDVSWLNRVNFVLCDGSLGKSDQQWLTKFESLNLGMKACNTELTDRQLQLAKIGEKLGMERLIELAPDMVDARLMLGTRESLGNGDREIFAEGTYIGQWGLPPVEASYRRVANDSDGELLDGSKHEYKMTFKAPNVSEFWSVTIYANDNRLMARNRLNRHSRSDRSLTPDADGNYTIIFSKDADTYAQQVNFLPIPNKPFYPVMRLYGPDEEIQSGKYLMPELVKIK
jgi:hypothetical protein